MTPEAQGATAEGFTRGEHRPTVRGEARPEDWNEAPRRRASEHSRERPEGEGVKPHPRKLPDPPTAPQPKNKHNRTLLNIPRGESNCVENLRACTPLAVATGSWS
jgi:hypothetical protein